MNHYSTASGLFLIMQTQMMWRKTISSYLLTRIRDKQENSRSLTQLFCVPYWIKVISFENALSRHNISRITKNQSLFPCFEIVRIFRLEDLWSSKPIKYNVGWIMHNLQRHLVVGTDRNTSLGIILLIRLSSLLSLLLSMAIGLYCICFWSKS